MCVCVCVCARARVRLCARACARACVCVLARACGQCMYVSCVCVCVTARTHARTHSRTHAGTHNTHITYTRTHSGMRRPTALRSRARRVTHTHACARKRARARARFRWHSLAVAQTRARTRTHTHARARGHAHARVNPHLLARTHASHVRTGMYTLHVLTRARAHSCTPTNTCTHARAGCTDLVRAHARAGASMCTTIFLFHINIPILCACYDAAECERGCGAILNSLSQNSLAH